MDFQVIFKDTFVGDLEQIVRRIAFHNPGAAQRLGKIIIRIAESLSFFPERFPRVRQRPAIRRFVVRKYFKVFTAFKPTRRPSKSCVAGMVEENPIQ